MKWYQSQLILLDELVLLSYVIRRVLYVALKEEERSATKKCRRVAHETICNISSATHLNKMTGWNAIWFIFQAHLVTLFGLLMTDNAAVDATGTIYSCRAQVEIIMVALAQMQLWSPAAKRTLEVVSRIYDAANRFHGDGSEGSEGRTTQSAALPNTQFPLAREYNLLSVWNKSHC
ncbi:hypothetical protein BDFG_07186 [Blastomyces dermatitidis ATCC 26199]|nr:hypothetical protein BDFG_07186 [Blastomyces dermatitidis ATCC 26199]